MLVVAASRFWGTCKEEYTCLESFLSDLLPCVDVVIVLIRTDLDKTDSLSLLGKKYASLLGHKLVLLSTTSQYYTLCQGLNYLLKTAIKWIEENHGNEQLPLILFVSVEIRPSRVIKYLVNVMDEDTLCAGCAIPQEHMTIQSIRGLEWLEQSICADEHVQPICSVWLSAMACPWNTCCVWNINYLQRTGFLMVAETMTPPGMEEVAVIVTQQKLFGIARRQVKLVYLPSPLAPRRHMQGYSCDRLRCHEKKMERKQRRTEQIVELLGNFKAATCLYSALSASIR
ncbi:hypothetical protein GAYE_SCF20G4106 [Galdieria yellowstonensis]|uniref:Uncharacterized protein n=1 Tax=Galdieria yellowstonensis TaxID=3028027 RepID=A0AAV9IFL3_9RHOD|nr:hypothetical protein GAYE_SCF20G4106 [Galdieria yellowstonensis]